MPVQGGNWEGSRTHHAQTQTHAGARGRGEWARPCDWHGMTRTTALSTCSQSARWCGTRQQWRTETQGRQVEIVTEIQNRGESEETLEHAHLDARETG